MLPVGDIGSETAMLLLTSVRAIVEEPGLLHGEEVVNGG